MGKWNDEELLRWILSTFGPYGRSDAHLAAILGVLLCATHPQRSARERGMKSVHKSRVRVRAGRNRKTEAGVDFNGARQ